jgi:predicted short-subunit dehydrogenase-like oxidoreductase (DUF2520 family)
MSPFYVALRYFALANNYTWFLSCIVCYAKYLVQLWAIDNYEVCVCVRVRACTATQNTRTQKENSGPVERL